jgi:hypothetical protein
MASAAEIEEAINRKVAALQKKLTRFSLGRTRPGSPLPFHSIFAP